MRQKGSPIALESGRAGFNNDIRSRIAVRRNSGGLVSRHRLCLLESGRRPTRRAEPLAHAAAPAAASPRVLPSIMAASCPPSRPGIFCTSQLAGGSRHHGRIMFPVRHLPRAVHVCRGPHPSCTRASTRPSDPGPIRICGPAAVGPPAGRADPGTGQHWRARMTAVGIRHGDAPFRPPARSGAASTPQPICCQADRDSARRTGNRPAVPARSYLSRHAILQQFFKRPAWPACTIISGAHRSGVADPTFCAIFARGQVRRDRSARIVPGT